MLWAKEEKFPMASAKPSAPLSGFWRNLFDLDILGEMVQIKVEGFDGPLDLLLELIDREQLNITALSIAEVSDQYWREIEAAEGIDPDTLAEFINVGSKLLYIKSCALIPSAEPPSSGPARADRGGRRRADTHAGGAQALQGRRGPVSAA